MRAVLAASPVGIVLTQDRKIKLGERRVAKHVRIRQRRRIPRSTPSIMHLLKKIMSR